ncbi:jg9707 [Pararge aegeria aegeria]|uniref:Jg9707 protein n=1 Tax=Pararge aegeria aegeria TaxID=348720 RepID=A0A8S4SLX9_9NEOP|nr:jg9707 [Pararge aegeria aegeria]
MGEDRVVKRIFYSELQVGLGMSKLNVENVYHSIFFLAKRDVGIFEGAQPCSCSLALSAPTDSVPDDLPDPITVSNFLSLCGCFSSFRISRVDTIMRVLL